MADAPAPIAMSDIDAELSSSSHAVVVAGTRGHVVFGTGPGRLAIWQVSPTGEKSGAWVSDCDDDVQHARALLTLVERRAIAGVDRDQDLAMLKRLAHVADVPVPRAYEEHWVDLCRVHTEIATAREELWAAVQEQQTTRRSRLQNLSYVYDVASVPVPRELPRALEAYGLGSPRSDAEPAAVEAIGKANMLAAVVARWADTESARLRRPYLRKLGGPAARPLPPTWLEHLVAVYDAVLPL